VGKVQMWGEWGMKKWNLPNSSYCLAFAQGQGYVYDVT
jgi:hypothetical protein